MRQGPDDRRPQRWWQESGCDLMRNGESVPQGCDVGGHRVTASECRRDLESDVVQAWLCTRSLAGGCTPLVMGGSSLLDSLLC